MGTGFFPGVKRPGRGLDHPPPSSAEVKERIELYLYSTSGPSWPILGWTVPLPFRQQKLWSNVCQIRRERGDARIWKTKQKVKT